MPWADATFTTWIMERYQLFHGAEWVGIVECDGGAADFPQFWCGSLELDPEVPGRFRAFFRLGWRWIESDGRGEDARTMRAELEADFGDLVHTTAWRLIDPDGKDIPLSFLQPQRGETVSWARVDGLDWGRIAEPVAAADRRP